MAPTFTVDWAKSPRIIIVDSPATEVIQQDLIDALRELESELGALDDDALIYGSGKETLDASGTLVGITNTLLNALLGFEAETTAESEGSATSADPLGKTLTDTGATFQSDGVQAGALIINFTDKSVAAVIRIVDENTIIHTPLADGSDDQWEIGDAYKIWNIKQCIVSGGNLVAQDDAGNPLATPIYPSPLTQVVLTSSSSATLQELQDLQHASFNGGVTVDTNSSYSGTTYPVGTPRQPVNNLADALLIASSRGFTRFYIMGNITIDSGGDYSNKIFEGESPTKSQITIQPAANVLNCEFENAHVLGTLDGGVTLRGCLVTDLTYVDGYIEQCVLGLGTITLSGVDAAYFLDCWSGVAGPGEPIINLGGSGSVLNVRNYNGGLRLINKTGNDKVSLDINSGEVILDPTVTVSAQDEVVVRGVGNLTNNAVNPEYVNAYGLVSLASIVTATLDAIYIDTVNGEAGTEFPIGTPTHPVNNLTDARTIADKQGIKEYRFRGPLTLNTDHEGFAITGTGSILTDVLTVTGVSVKGTKFTRCTVAGTVIGTDTQYEECALYNLSGVQGLALSTGIFGTLALAAGTTFTGRDIAGSNAFIDLGGGGGQIVKFKGSGAFTLLNAVNTDIIQIGLSIGTVTIDATCTAGALFAINGDCTLVDESTDATVVNGTTIQRVWDEDLSKHSPPTSPADYVKRIAGLVGEYKRIHTIVRDGDGNLTSAKMDIYDNEADYDAQTNPIATYDVDATFVNELLETFGMKPQ